MIQPTAGRRLIVDADLQLTVDGVDATLVGRHGELTLRTDEPLRFVRALRRGGGLTALRLLDDRLALPGLERPAVTVDGPRGRIARFAPDARRQNLRASPAGTNVLWYQPHGLIPSAVRWTAAAVVASIAALLLRRRLRP